jgi:hypothetical protein
MKAGAARTGTATPSFCQAVDAETANWIPNTIDALAEHHEIYAINFITDSFNYKKYC